MTLEITERQANLLSTFLIMTTEYRKRELAALKKFAEEQNSDGTPRFPIMKNNAKHWEEIDTEMNNILELLWG